ncbi:MAG: potassium/proton antiporter [Bacteroidales bacterium]|nr:potassium/proton antiporter [Bacteroidales bacterium]
MDSLIVIVAVVILANFFLGRMSQRLGVPDLLAFILLGILFSQFPIFRGVSSNPGLAGNFCDIALVFIMFYGGFCTRWKAAKAIVAPASLLASVGVFLTAALTALLVHFFLHWGWLESLLLGSVLGSTDAASVFFVLRARQLGLKENATPLLEMESGANDPCSNMMVAITLLLMQGRLTALKAAGMMAAQIGFGLLGGLLVAVLAILAVRRFGITTSVGGGPIFFTAVALLAFGFPSIIGGNGFLGAYVVGLILGNQEIANKKELVHFFNGITGVMQMGIFFVLGLLANLKDMAGFVGPSLLVFLILLLFSRPISMAAILLPFRKFSWKTIMLVSFGGLKGASSIVFAVLAASAGVACGDDIFQIVFCVTLISSLLQGCLLPYMARWLDCVDPAENAMETFNDFSDETMMQFNEVLITAESHWKDRAVKDLGLPKNVLICMLIHADGSRIVPNGYTVLHEGDKVIICSKEFQSEKLFSILRRRVTPKYVGKTLKEYPAEKNHVVLVKRGEESIIPHGDTVFMEGDILYINDSGVHTDKKRARKGKR